MAETKNHHRSEQRSEDKPENPRKAIRDARAARLRVIEGPPKTIKVYAASEALRGTLRHANGARFRPSLDQGVEWPNDSFTARRIAEGSVRTDGPATTSEQPEADPTQNPREQAAANKPNTDAPEAAPESRKERPERRQPPHAEQQPAG